MAYGFHFLLFIFSTFSINLHACKETERSSLQSFDITLSTSIPLNWTSGNCCHWEGVSCDLGGSVTHLSLPSKRLKLKGGNFPSSSLENLTNLIHLNLSHNSLSGSIEPSSGFFLYLSHLEVLDLSYNFLSGELPLSLPSISIRIVDLSNNNFHGAIPSSFFRQASNLTSFSVSNNTLSGSIPSSVCLSSSPLIRLLDVSFNNFNGSISHGIGECSQLKVFRAGNNNLSGFLPEDIYNATMLEEVALPYNSLYGVISDKIVNLTNLAILDLQFNNLSGMIPQHIGKLSKLKLLFLHFNNLEGSLPPSLMNCTDLRELNLGINHLEGNISTLNFSSLSQLSKLDLGQNQLTGILPSSLYSCKSLKAIRLSRNDLEGEINPEIISLTSLSFLSLGFNRLTNISKALRILGRCKSLVFLSFAFGFQGGELPAELSVVDFGGLQNLRLLSLSDCGFTGQIPVWLSKLKKLEVLDMSFNRITGSIPSWLGNLSRLNFLNLEANLISGELPKDLCRLPVWVSGKAATQEDDVVLELPVYGSRGPTVFVQFTLSYIPPAMDLKSNNISGSIPIEIGQLRLLRNLDLSNNNFSGNIPEQISNIKNMETLYLFNNHLSGKIPSSLARLNFLKDFNVSYNDLEGEIPTSTQLQSFSSSAFEGNPKLCGAPLSTECRPAKGKDAKDNEDSREDEDEDEYQVPWLHVSVILGFILGFWGFCGPLLLNKKWRYAYIKVLDNAQDRIYVMVIRCMAKMQRRFRT
ncbi:receptor-like protein 2 [Argentina anserina]|uniref:receptor-like protein 2 n=1 Tax=Argentina anserina TaxID=57926 RepID=UPI0021764BB8|nr:receptor-like protein 2 [Potentilla anserina]